MTSVAVVTGGASGLGLALAQALAARGRSVVVLDRSKDVERVAGELAVTGPATATGIEVDVRDRAGIDEALARVRLEHGRLDLLVNNAAVMRPGDALDLTMQDWDEVIDVNLRGAVNTIAAGYPVMVEQGHGQILNVSSVVGLLPGPLNVPYAMSKHALVGLSLSLRAEAETYGVKVSVACPSAVQTALLQTRGAPGSRADVSPMPALWKRRAAWALIGLPGRAATPEHTAEQILAGLERDVAVIPTGHARVAWRIARANPAITQWGARLQARSLR